MKYCDYCNLVLPKKNKQFCHRECQISYMKLRECPGCGKLIDPDHMVDRFCGTKCRDKTNYRLRFANIATVLGYGVFGNNEYELVEVVAYIKNKKSGEIKEVVMKSEYPST